MDCGFAPPRRKRWRCSRVRITVCVAAIMVIAALVGIAACGEKTPAATPDGPVTDMLVGSWQEVDTGESYVLKITRCDTQDMSGYTRYTVDYPRSFKVPFPAGLKADTLEIWGDGGPADVIWTVSYDEQTDHLKAVHRVDGETFMFRRIEDR